MQNSRPHAALLASPGKGHLGPVLELGKHLITHHNFRIILFVVSTDVSTKQSLLNSPFPDLTIDELPFEDISTLVHTTDHIAVNIVTLMRESLPSLQSAISNMEFKPRPLIVDPFGIEAFSVADEYNMSKYVFVTTNAWFLAVTIYAPTAKNIMEEHFDKKKPLQLPGCRPVRFEDKFEEFLYTDNEVYEGFTRVGTKIPMADGILINTWEDFDSITVGSLRDPKELGKIVRAPVYPIGPLYRQAEAVVGKAEHVIEWLDTKPVKSVIYISFGSSGTLSTKQIEELAWGLELSRQRFIWVFRAPVDDGVVGSFSAIGEESEALKAYLPDGFLTRNQGVGLVIPMWAPQSEILAHPSTGEFLMHCGWNSSIESIMSGVPMIAWPLCADQKMNPTQLLQFISSSCQRN